MINKIKHSKIFFVLIRLLENLLYYSKYCIFKKNKLIYRREFQTTKPPKKILDWQKREQLIQTKIQPHVYMNFSEEEIKKVLLSIRDDVISKIIYKKDIDNYNEKDYWATSKEIEEKLFDDCDGQAVLIYTYLRRFGFPEDSIGLCIVDGHMFAIYQKNSENFFILDNGFITHNIRNGNKFFPVKRKGKISEPLYGFNLNKWWRYVK